MIAVTGASGFLGRAVVSELLQRGLPPRAVVRTIDERWRRVDGVETIAVGSIDGSTDWSHALTGVTAVIHCVARTHFRSERSQDAMEAYLRINRDGTRRLATQAAALGVDRLVFVSSVKVNGESTTPGHPFSHAHTPAPQGSYGVSKWEAEKSLWEIAASSGLDVVIVRPPLIYGRGVKGNLARLLSLVRTGVPLPFGAVDNRRSLIGIDNLVDFLISVTHNPVAAGRTFLVSDGDDLSTPELVRQMATAIGRSPRLFNCPPKFLFRVARMLGRADDIERLVGFLQVDASEARQLLRWNPPVSVAEGVRRMVYL